MICSGIRTIMETISTNHEKYGRLALMLVKEGTKTTRALFEKCYKNMTPTYHVPFPWTVDEFLQENKYNILSYQTGKRKQRIFFPEASGTNIDNWDLSMFCFVLLDVCKVSQAIRMDVDQLEKVRNALFHMKEPSIEDERYERYVDKIEVIFERLLAEIDDQVLKKEVEGVVQAAKRGPLSLQYTLKSRYTYYSMEGETREVLSQQSIEDIQQQENVPTEIENDPYYLNLYTEAISKGKEIDTTIRVNVVGNFRQGKTSLVKQLIQESSEGVKSTNSVEINHCKYEYIQNYLTFNTVKRSENEDNTIDRIASVAHSDLIKENQDEKKNPTANPVQTGKQVPSSSSSSYCFSSDSTKEFELINGVKLEEATSTVSQVEQNKFKKILQNSQAGDQPQRDLEIWDFGGQFSFYATHNLFHSRRAVYLLVFDLSKSLSSIMKDSDFPDRDEEKTMEQYAKFWINSIHSYVGSVNGTEPPVILVGTHKDTLKGDEHEQQAISNEYFEQIRKLFDKTNMIRHIQQADFAVDNTNPNDKRIAELRKEIIRQGKELAEISIPAKWIPLEREVRKHRHEKIISFEELMNIDSTTNFPLKDEEQVKLFLLYHHSKGTLLYYDEEPISAYVVLDTQYLIDAFKCIITSIQFCRRDPESRDLWNVLTKDARLENKLIEKLWSKNTENDFMKYKKELLMFLEKHLIISEALVYLEKSLKSEGLGWYIVPSLLRSNSTEDVLTEFLKGRRRTSVRFVMSFYQSPLVQVLFYRLLAALIGKWPIMKIPVDEMPSSGWKKGQRTLIYENLGVFELDDNHAGIVVHKDNDIDLWVHTLCPSLDICREMADKFRRFSESIVQNEFVKLRHSRSNQEIPYTAYIKCNDESHGPGGGVNRKPLDDVRANTRGKRACPDKGKHEIDRDQILSEWFLEDKIKLLCPDHQLDDKELSKVALALGYNWELLGLELGLGNAQIQQIDMVKNTSEMKIYTMLLLWKAEKEDLATIKVLIDAMETDTHVYVQWDIIRNIVDKINSDRQES